MACLENIVLYKNELLINLLRWLLRLQLIDLVPQCGDLMGRMLQELLHERAA